MLDYMNKVKRGFRDQHNFKPDGGTEADPTFNNIPDGVYPMVIDGKIDHVKITNDRIHCCRWDADKD